MPKFFIDKENIKNNTAKIVGQDATHIARVLRHTVGDRITVCDGFGFDYSAEITEVLKDEIYLNLSDKYRCPSEASVKITLFQCLPKGSKMEYIIEKCTELGIFSVVPVASKRCVVKIEDEKKEARKTQKWQKTADEAVKQCQRGIIPKVYDIKPFNEAVKMVSEFDVCIVAYECEEENTLKAVLKNNNGAKNVGIFIGPEGGFEPAEVLALKEAGAFSVTLGKRILRTETAGICVLSAVMYEFGGF